MAWLSLPLSSPVLGSLQTLPDAGQAPAGPCLPAARAPAPDPPLHPGADTVLGCALDPQVYDGRHHLPSHGKMSAVFPLVFSRFRWGRCPGETHPSLLLHSGLILSGSQRQAQIKIRVVTPGQVELGGGGVVEWRGEMGMEVVCGG